MAERIITTAPARTKADRVGVLRYSVNPQNNQQLVRLEVRTAAGVKTGEAEIVIAPGWYEGKLEYDLNGNPSFDFTRTISAGIGAALDADYCAAGGGGNARETAILTFLAGRAVIPA